MKYGEIRSILAGAIGITMSVQASSAMAQGEAVMTFVAPDGRWELAQVPSGASNGSAPNFPKNPINPASEAVPAVNGMVIRSGQPVSRMALTPTPPERRMAMTKPVPGTEMVITPSKSGSGMPILQGATGSIPGALPR
jgi:hypothetical protein